MLARGDGGGHVVDRKKEQAESADRGPQRHIR
jgi:hypothetical protein